MTVGVPASEERQASNDEQYHAPRTFACGVFFEGENHRLGPKGVLVEQDGEVRVASMRNKLIGDVGNMITGFLKNNLMEPSTGRRNNIGGIPAGLSWIPLIDRETVLIGKT